MLSAAKHLALVGPKTQSEILRFAQNDSEGLRMTSARGSFSSQLSPLPRRSEV